MNAKVLGEKKMIMRMILQREKPPSLSRMILLALYIMQLIGGRSGSKILHFQRTTMNIQARKFEYVAKFQTINHALSAKSLRD